MRRRNNVKGQLAVVTGASGGIGFCFCRELAAGGCSLLMVSNEEEALNERAKELRKEFGTAIYELCLDLTASDATTKIIEYLDTRNLEPDYLINNAGIFSFLPVTETSEPKIRRFIDLHIRAVTDLSRAFATRFMRRGSGRILNMSSMSCWMPMPGIAMYSSTKAYIRVFSRALHYEVKDAGVTVTVACPGGIATDLFGLPEPLKKLAVNLKVLDTPEKFASKAIKKMLKGKKQYINGWLNRISIVAVSMAPTPVRMLVKRKMLDKNIVRP